MKAGSFILMIQSGDNSVVMPESAPLGQGTSVTDRRTNRTVIRSPRLFPVLLGCCGSPWQGLGDSGCQC